MRPHRPRRDAGAPSPFCHAQDPRSPAAHLDGHAVGTLAARTGVRRVLLTHLLMGFSPEKTIASVRRSYGGPVEPVQPGDSFTIEG